MNADTNRIRLPILVLRIVDNLAVGGRASSRICWGTQMVKKYLANGKVRYIPVYV